MQIIRQLIEIILRKREPQDIVFDIPATIISAMVMTLLGVMVYSQIPQISKPFLYNIAMVAFKCLGIYGLLAINQKANRFVQTILAIFGVSVILQILILTVSLVPFLAPLGLIFMGWNFVIIVLILRAALECSIFKALILTIGYHIFMVVLMSVVFPSFSLEMQAFLESLSAEAQASRAG